MPALSTGIQTDETVTLDRVIVDVGAVRAIQPHSWKQLTNALHKHMVVREDLGHEPPLKPLLRWKYFIEDVVGDDVGLKEHVPELITTARPWAAGLGPLIAGKMELLPDDPLHTLLMARVGNEYKSLKSNMIGVSTGSNPLDPANFAGSSTAQGNEDTNPKPRPKSR